MKQDEDKSEVGSSYSKAETKSEYTALHLIQSNWKTCCIKDDDPENQQNRNRNVATVRFTADYGF